MQGFTAAEAGPAATRTPLRPKRLVPRISTKWYPWQMRALRATNIHKVGVCHLSCVDHGSE
eukprot:12180202-Prorocentrum_lima.AAC.1